MLKDGVAFLIDVQHGDIIIEDTFLLCPLKDGIMTKPFYFWWGNAVDILGDEDDIGRVVGRRNELDQVSLELVSYLLN